MRYVLARGHGLGPLAYYLTGDSDQESFVDALTENIITELSHIENLFVIDRHSSFAYKGKPVKMKEVAERGQRGAPPVAWPGLLAPGVDPIPWPTSLRAAQSTRGALSRPATATQHDIGKPEAENLRQGSADELFNWEISVK